MCKDVLDFLVFNKFSLTCPCILPFVYKKLIKKRKSLCFSLSRAVENLKKFRTAKTRQMKLVGGLCSLQHLLKCLDIEFAVIALSL